MRSELLFIKQILDGYAVMQKVPRFITDAVEMYGQTYCDPKLSDTRERVENLIKQTYE